MVFWCCHSEQSEMVRYELLRAIELNKIIIPILCCSYEVDEIIKDFQWIDMKKQLNHSCISTSDHLEIIPPIRYSKRGSINSLIPFFSLLILITLILIKPFPAFFGDTWATITNKAMILTIAIIVFILFFKIFISKARRPLTNKQVDMRGEDYEFKRNYLIKKTISNALRETQIDPFYFYPSKYK